MRDPDVARREGGPARPRADVLALLTPVERLGFRLADARTRLGHHPADLWRRTLTGSLIRICGGRRLRVHGVEHIARFGPDDSLLLVANHRSFFDFFVIAAVLHWESRVPHRMLFPVRADFFYDHPVGIGVNLVLSGMSMFPPVLRQPSRARFNRYGVARCVAELKRGGTVVGVHPEGTRNRGPDPYTLLPAQSGAGQVALQAGVPVVPVFVVGMGSSLASELARNLWKPRDHPIDVMFGPPVDLEDLRAARPSPATRRRAAERCLAAVAELGRIHGELAGQEA